MEADADVLAKQWQRVFDNQLGVEEFKQLAVQTRDFLKDVPKRTQATNAQLMEIMMAQDFQDLTGQVIKKVVAMAQRMEHDMLQLLIAADPADPAGERPGAQIYWLLGVVIGLLAIAYAVSVWLKRRETGGRSAR